MNDAAIAALVGLRADELESAFAPLAHALAGAIEAQGREPRFDALLRPYASRRLAARDRVLRDGAARRIAEFGVERFLKRAALLHADIGIGSPFAHVTTRAGLGNLAADGEYGGQGGRPWHWMLGRSLLHLLSNELPDPYALLWHQAAGAYLLEARNFTEATPLLEDARRLFPDDAELWFLTGLQHEAKGSASVQAAIADHRARTAQARTRIEIAVRSAAAENRDARVAYERALLANPDHVEASVHHAYQLLLDEQASQAVAELRALTGTTLEPKLAYYAALLLGRAEAMNGALDEARRAYAAASTLFPDAQSPRLGLAQLELQSGHREGARPLFDFLSARADDDPESDPWWSFHRKRVPSASSWWKKVRTAVAELDR